MISKLVFLLDTNTLSNLAMACTHAKRKGPISWPLRRLLSQQQTMPQAAHTLSNLAMACTHAKSTHAKSTLALWSLLSPGRSLCRLALRRSLLSAPDHAPDHASDCPRLPQAAPGCPKLPQANPG